MATGRARGLPSLILIATPRPSGEPDRVDRLGARLADQARNRAVQLELVTAGTGHILRMAPDRRRDAMLSTFGCAGDAPECASQAVERDRIERGAAAVDRQVGGLLVSKIIDGLHDRQLNRMIRIAVAGDVAAVQRQRS